MLYTQAIHHGTLRTGSLYYTAQHVYSYTYTQAAYIVQYITCYTHALHLLDTYTMSNTYTCIVYYREMHVYTLYIHTPG